MFDPAAMGTLLIGLEANRAESRSGRRRRSTAVMARREHGGIRLALANGLRRAAAFLEPRTTGEACI